LFHWFISEMPEKMRKSVEQTTDMHFFFNVPQNLNFLAGQDGQDIKKEWIPALQHRDRDSIGSRTHSDLGRLEEAGRC
jgi:hypothetical protein